MTMMTRKRTHKYVITVKMVRYSCHFANSSLCKLKQKWQIGTYMYQMYHRCWHATYNLLRKSIGSSKVLGTGKTDSRQSITTECIILLPSSSLASVLSLRQRNLLGFLLRSSKTLQKNSKKKNYFLQQWIIEQISNTSLLD